MKAVVVELKYNHAAVLSDDGCIVKIKNKHYEVGQIIQLDDFTKTNYRKISTFVAAAAACVLLSVGTWAYASPYSYVSMDVNPSLEFTVNRFDRVLNVKAMNEDGQDILNNISIKKLKNRTITDALNQSVDQISAAGYFKKDTPSDPLAEIVIATSSDSKNKANQLAEELQQSVEQQTYDNHDEVSINVFSVAKVRVQEAKALGVTPGKLTLVRKLQEECGDPSTIDTNKWINEPIKDILKATKEYREINKKKKLSPHNDKSITPTPTPPIKDNNNGDGKQNSPTKNSNPNNTTKNSDKDNKSTDKSSNQNDKPDKNNDKTNNHSDKSDNNTNKANKNSTKTDKNTDKANKNNNKSDKNTNQSNKNNDKSNKNTDTSNKNSDKLDKNTDTSNKNNDKSDKNTDTSN